MDCERVRAGFPVQPVDALTALAFVAVGVFLVARHRGAGPAVYGLLLVAVGTTSFMLHGMELDAAAESIAVISLALWIVVWVAFGASGRSVAAWTVATVVAGALISIAPAVRHVMTAVAWGVAALLLVRLRDRKVWVAFGVAAVAVAVYVLGRTGGPWCVPTSPLQGHGLWHLMMAVALWLVGDALAARQPTPRPAAPAVPGT